MIMTTEDIIREYRLAGNKKEKVKTLADLNCVSNEEMAMLLQENGQEVDKRFFSKPPKKKPAAEPEKEPEVPAVCTLTQQEAYTLVDFIDSSIKGMAFDSMPEVIHFVRVYEILASCGGEEEDG